MILFIVKYAIQGIVKHKKRSLLMAMGFTIGISMVSALYTWIETGPTVFAADYINVGGFQIAFSKPDVTEWSFIQGNFSYSMWDTYAFARSNSLVGEIEAVYSTVYLFNTENKSDSFRWYPPQVEDPILMGSVFFVNDSFFEVANEQLSLVDGELAMDDDGVLVSEPLLAQINNTLGIFKIGSNISFAVAQRIAWPPPPNFFAEEMYLGYWERVFFRSLKIKGVYRWIPKKSLIDQSLRNIGRSSMFMPMYLLNGTLREAMERPIPRAPGHPKLFIQLDPDNVVLRGITNLEQEVSKLIAEIHYSCEGEIITKSDVGQIGWFIGAYRQTRSLLIYILPMIGLSVCVAIFSIEVTFGGRQVEAGILKAKGVTSRQLAAIFAIEFIILAIVGVIFGFFFGIILGCLIPATKGIFEYDIVTFQKFITHATVSPENILFSIPLCGIAPMVYILFKARSYATTDVMKAIAPPSMREVEARRSYVPNLFFFGTVLATLIYLRSAINLLPTAISLEGGYVLFPFVVYHWLAFSYAAALLVSLIMPKISKIFAFPLKIKGTLVALDLKRQIFTPLMAIIILTSSILVYCIVEREIMVETVTNQTNYAIGCDLRIHTYPQPPSLTEKMRNASSSITDIIPILTSRGEIGRMNVRIIGVDPSAYKRIGFWMPASTQTLRHEQMLDSLAETYNGTLISDHIAETLSLDIGSHVKVTGEYINGSIYNLDFVVAGIIYSAPGFGEAEPTEESRRRSLGFQEEDRFIIVNNEFLASRGVDRATLFLLGIGDKEAIEKTIETFLMMPEVTDVYSPLTFDLSKVDLYKFLYIQGFTSSLTIQFLITIIVSAVSFVFFLDYTISKRNVEFALMRAVGATKKDIAKLILMEFIAILLPSVIVGLSLGMAYSLVLFDFSLRIFPFKSIVPYIIAIPVIDLAICFAISFLSMALGSYLPARRASRTDVAKVLRNL